MFKAQVLRRGFSLWNKVPTSRIVRSAARDGHGMVHIQRVRFRKPFFGWPRLLGTAIITASAYGFLKWLGEGEGEEEREEEQSMTRLRRETDEEEEDVEDVKGEEVDEEDEVDVLLFLPTGFSRAKSQTWYKGSDPEWQEFIRIAPDKERTQRIRMELVSLVRELVMNSPSYKIRLGKIRSDAGNVWLEIKFPDGPPIEYERPGIEVTEDLTVRWTTRSVEEFHHHRLNNALLPIAVANSLYADAKVNVIKNWYDFMNYIGWENKSQGKRKSLTKILTPPLPSKPNSSTSTTPPKTAPDTAPSATATSQQQTESQSSSPPAPKGSTAQALGKNASFKRFLPSLPPPTNMTPNLRVFWLNLRNEMHKKQVQMQPPRGTFMVSGLIEIIGDRARMTLDVAAAYDPKIGKYVMLRAKMRSITDHRQYPRGGH